VSFGPLAAEIGLPVWGTPANFNGFCDLAAFLHGSQVGQLDKNFDMQSLWCRVSAACKSLTAQFVLN